MKTRRKNRRTIVPILIGMLYIVPILMLVLNSFKTQGEIVSNFLAFPSSFSFSSIREAAKVLNYGLSFRNTAIVTLSVTVLTCVVSFMCAYGCSHLTRGSNALYMFFVLGQMVPFNAIMVPVYMNASSLGLTNSFVGMAIFGCGFNVAFGIVMYIGFLKTVTKELEEAAEIDGAGILSTMFRVVFPLVGPTTATLSIMYFLWTWNDFLFPVLMLSDASKRTLMSNIANFRTTTTTRWDLMIAGLMICMLPIIVIYVFAQKYIVSDVTAGAIK